jgi:glucose dehydrogenase
LAAKGIRGQYVAMEIKTGKILWRHSMPTSPGGAALTTAGGLMFGADTAGYAFALDAANGKLLFQTRLMTAVAGYPVTYAIGDTQYLAVPAGNRGASGAALYVFALPPSARGALR